MKQFKTVLKFEYLNQIKAKSYIVVTALLLAVILIVSFLPQIMNGLGSLFGSDDGSATQELSDAAIFDESGLFKAELFNGYDTGYEWTDIDSIDNAEQLIEDNTYDVVVHIDGYDVNIYESGTDTFISNAYNVISEATQMLYQASYLSEAGLSESDISEFLSLEPNINRISVGKDSSENYFINYALLMVLYMALIFYGQSISMSVVTEKTSKAMELLVTSAKPMQLMFGKVIGVGLAGLTQFAMILVTTVLGLSLNLNSWMESYPAVGLILENSLSIDIFIYAIVFFLLGFFTFAFVYAALCSTVSRVEDVNGIVMIPQLLLIAAFLVSITSLSLPEANYVTVLSFVPFFSPMLMFMRTCLLDIPIWQILISILANIFYIILLGLISSKIYKVGIMIYGNKPKLKDIIKYIKS